ncbi:MAG: hypothetical protein HKO99_09165 [Xanthomonadales bacterium]|nr:hypothetical protein [Gammaproteobacteria bacterium]MBT8054104.1 hypothetical protein [Gammaproteobacteria bacterium]NNK51750.1 hypothetical protein [Xanthomonadales bacterium]
MLYVNESLIMFLPAFVIGGKLMDVMNSYLDENGMLFRVIFRGPSFA